MLHPSYRWMQQLSMLAVQMLFRMVYVAIATYTILEQHQY